MKTKILILFLLASFYAVSQNSSKKFWYGLRFGLDACTNNLDQLQEQLQGNYQIGIFTQIGNKLYLQPEVYYASYKTSSNEINSIKAPLLVGVRFLDLGVVSTDLTGGTTYTKILADSNNNNGTFKWTLGLGADFLGFLTTDIRYQFANHVNSSEIQDLIDNGGMVNITVGVKL